MELQGTGPRWIFGIVGFLFIIFLLFLLFNNDWEHKAVANKARLHQTAIETARIWLPTEAKILTAHPTNGNGLVHVIYEWEGHCFLYVGSVREMRSISEVSFCPETPN